MEQVSSAFTNPKYTIPEPRQAVVRRQRLVDFLHQNIDQPLQLLCAPAGYGKTTLMADFARDTDIPVCWYAIDELDRDPRSFSTNLFQVLKTRFPFIEIPSELQQSKSPEASADWRNMANAFTDIIRQRIPEYFALIIDDFHIISGNQEVLDALDLVMQHLPDNCRVILSTRELPQLVSLPRLISERRVAGIGPAELRFTANEIKDLLKKNFDLDVSDREANRLEQESEGWITAILLTTHSLWKGLFQEVLNKQGENTLLYEYMASEVLYQQPKETQQFLLATSIFNNEIGAELADSITGNTNSEEVLKDIEGRNLFLARLEGPRPWYRYHHMFRDFLRDKITTESPNLFLELHIKAAQYFVNKEDIRQAIPHYIEGKDYDSALEQLESEVESLAQDGLWDTIGNWMELIPEDIRQTKPKLLLQLASVYQRRGHNDAAIKLLTQVIDVFKQDNEPVLEAQALMRRSVALRAKGANQMAVRDARQSLSLAEKHGTIKDQADARNHLGRAYGTQGKFPRAEKEFRLALEGYQQEGDLYQLSHTHGMLGIVYTDMANFGQATSHFEFATQGWRKLENQSELSLTLNNMAMLYYEQGRYKDAERVANESIVLSQATNSIRNECYALSALGDVYLERGEYQAAMETFQKGLDLARECTQTSQVSYCLIGLGRTNHLMGDSHQAKALLREGLVLAHDLDLDKELGMAYTSLGIIEAEVQNYEESLAILQRASTILERSRQMRNLARARFHLAHTFFQTKNYADALEQLGTVAQICKEIDQSLFLIEDAKHATLMVQYAAVNNSASRDFFARLKDDVNKDSTGSTEDDSPEMDSSSQSLTAPTIEVLGFNSTRIILDGNPILSTAWGSAKAREMFLFMVFKGEAIHKDKIVEALWPHISPSKANANFHSTLHRMKSALYPDCVERDGEYYQLNSQWQYTFDVHTFEDLLRNADNAPYESNEREQLMLAAIDAYMGTLLEDLDSGWCNQLRTELEFKFWKAVNDIADRYKERGDVKESIVILEKAIEIDEFQEEVYYKIMDLYLEIEDTASATRIYRRCTSIFGETVQMFDSAKVANLLSNIN